MTYRPRAGDRVMRKPPQPEITPDLIESYKDERKREDLIKEQRIYSLCKDINELNKRWKLRGM